MGSTSVGSAPVGSAPVGSAPVGSAPVGSAPVGGPVIQHTTTKQFQVRSNGNVMRHTPHVGGGISLQSFFVPELQLAKPPLVLVSHGPDLFSSPYSCSDIIGWVRFHPSCRPNDVRIKIRRRGEVVWPM